MRPHGKRARVNPGNPEAFAQCDRCGDWVNRTGLQWQYQWSATHIYSLGILVCNKCYDTPFEQLRTIILPPDPPPVINARPPNFAFEEVGPVQGILAATAPRGATTLVLQPANGVAVQGAGSFNVGQVVWVQLVDAAYSANISFTQMQITSVSASSLGVKDLNSNAGLPASAPINGTVTVASIVVNNFTPTILVGANGAVFVDINGNLVEIG